MFRIFGLSIFYILTCEFVAGQSSQSQFSLGVNVGIESIVGYYQPGFREDKFHNDGIFTFGIDESVRIDNVNLFLSQIYSHVSIYQQIETAHHTAQDRSYTGSYLIFPIGFDIRLSKNTNSYIFLSNAYRIEFAFNQELIEGKWVTEKSDFILARQTVESGAGINFGLADALQLKFKVLYVFKPFYSENILLTDVSDSRIKINIGVSKYF